MIISDSRKFVFVHIPKNAGTSIRFALRPFGEDQWRGSRVAWHETLPAMMARHPELKSHFKFAFVRNPWERLVSLFFSLKQSGVETFRQFRDMENLEIMLRLLNSNAAWLCNMRALRAQCEYICGEDGRRLTDFVGRFENLEADFGLICRRIGIAAPLPRENVSSHGPYADYYNNWSRDFVAARYVRDIREFGYAFDGRP